MVQGDSVCNWPFSVSLYLKKQISQWKLIIVIFPLLVVCHIPVALMPSKEFQEKVLEPASFIWVDMDLGFEPFGCNAVMSGFGRLIMNKKTDFVRRFHSLAISHLFQYNVANADSTVLVMGLYLIFITQPISSFI